MYQSPLIVENPTPHLVQLIFTSFYRIKSSFPKKFDIISSVLSGFGADVKSPTPSVFLASLVVRWRYMA